MAFIRGVAVIFFVLALFAGNGDCTATDMAREVLSEINLARTRPDEYVDFLKAFRRTFRGNLYRLQERTFVDTEEGVAAVDEAIAYLTRQLPIEPLSWSPQLARAAAELVRESGRTGDTGHYGRRSGGPGQRIEKQGEWTGRVGEVIGYGPTDARLMVMQLIIDDGVPDRGHRKNIFSRDFRLGGVECGPHPRYRNMCVIDFASGFRTAK